MARKKPQPSQPELEERSDAITTTLMVVAALAAVTGFGVLFSLWWRTGISDNYEVLRIASQEFVKGRRIVAGELAERVEFEEQSDVLDEQDSQGDIADEDPSTLSRSAKAAIEARKELRHRAAGHRDHGRVGPQRLRASHRLDVDLYPQIVVAQLLTAGVGAQVGPRIRREVLAKGVRQRTHSTFPEGPP